MRREILTAEQYRERYGRPARPQHKYHAQPVVVDGTRFDSTFEAERYGELRIMERAGTIRHLTLQPRFLLQEGFRDRDGGWQGPIWYRGDFAYERREGGKWITVVEDVKGFETAAFKIKHKLFLRRFPHVELVLVTRDGPRESLNPMNNPSCGKLR